MTELHRLAADAAVVVAILLLAVVLLSLATGRLRRFGVDRLVLAGVAVVGLAGLAGLVLLASGHVPADPLHLVYGPVALLTLPVARYMARQGTERRRTLWMLLGSLVLAGVLLRLFMTGG